MSAVRMVAYGVLELKEINKSPLWTDHEEPLDKQAQFENDQLRKLVNEELHRYGLMMKRNIAPHKHGWRTKDKEYILYGQLTGPPGWKGRLELCIAGFKDCCIKAAQVLDDLDKSQLPDTATGID